ncbi:putative uncharacterized protein DDB_G0282133 isoform X2 [Daktulosphaira vitifoliae]|uniref:putative uncharacterized protein DDB_G0282133 isoform X2 n=1 Tax=Daktulosphaira vitifoliae TaxID=58002 RepID=UPI0021A9DEE3|nr:putative uncharacterized protein DDB_G0282133 isoform X2 [Daktulosphaira vitifoliae]
MDSTYFGFIKILKKNGELHSRYPIRSKECNFGRNISNDIRIALESVSAYHCTILFVDNKAYIRDKSLAGTTKVNGKRIGRNNFLLKDSDEIDIANRKFVFEYIDKSFKKSGLNLHCASPRVNTPLENNTPKITKTPLSQRSYKVCTPVITTANKTLSNESYEELKNKTNNELSANKPKSELMKSFSMTSGQNIPVINDCKITPRKSWKISTVSDNVSSSGARALEHLSLDRLKRDSTPEVNSSYRYVDEEVEFDSPIPLCGEEEEDLADKGVIVNDTHCDSSKISTKSASNDEVDDNVDWQPTSNIINTPEATSSTSRRDTYCIEDRNISVHQSSTPAPRRSILKTSKTAKTCRSKSANRMVQFARLPRTDSKIKCTKSKFFSGNSFIVTDDKTNETCDKDIEPDDLEGVQPLDSSITSLTNSPILDSIIVNKSSSKKGSRGNLVMSLVNSFEKRTNETSIQSVRASDLLNSNGSKLECSSSNKSSRNTTNISENSRKINLESYFVAEDSMNNVTQELDMVTEKSFNNVSQCSELIDENSMNNISQNDDQLKLEDSEISIQRDEKSSADESNKNVSQEESMINDYSEIISEDEENLVSEDSLKNITEEAKLIDEDSIINVDNTKNKVIDSTIENSLINGNETINNSTKIDLTEKELINKNSMNEDLNRKSIIVYNNLDSTDIAKNPYNSTKKSIDYVDYNIISEEISVFEEPERIVVSNNTTDEITPNDNPEEEFNFASPIDICPEEDFKFASPLDTNPENLTIENHSFVKENNSTCEKDDTSQYSEMDIDVSHDQSQNIDKFPEISINKSVIPSNLDTYDSVENITIENNINMKSKPFEQILKIQSKILNNCSRVNDKSIIIEKDQSNVSKHLHSIIGTEETPSQVIQYVSEMMNTSVDKLEASFSKQNVIQEESFVILERDEVNNSLDKSTTCVKNHNIYNRTNESSNNILTPVEKLNENLSNNTETQLDRSHGNQVNTSNSDKENSLSDDASNKILPCALDGLQVSILESKQNQYNDKTKKSSPIIDISENTVDANSFNAHHSQQMESHNLNNFDIKIKENETFIISTDFPVNSGKSHNKVIDISDTVNTKSLIKNASIASKSITCNEKPLNVIENVLENDDVSIKSVGKLSSRKSKKSLELENAATEIITASEDELNDKTDRNLERTLNLGKPQYESTPWNGSKNLKLPLNSSTDLEISQNENKINSTSPLSNAELWSQMMIDFNESARKASVSTDTVNAKAVSKILFNKNDQDKAKHTEFMNDYNKSIKQISTDTNIGNTKSSSKLIDESNKNNFNKLSKISKNISNNDKKMSNTSITKTSIMQCSTITSCSPNNDTTVAFDNIIKNKRSTRLQNKLFEELQDDLQNESLKVTPKRKSTRSRSPKANSQVEPKVDDIVVKSPRLSRSVTKNITITDKKKGKPAAINETLNSIEHQSSMTDNESLNMNKKQNSFKRPRKVNLRSRAARQPKNTKVVQDSSSTDTETKFSASENEHESKVDSSKSKKTTNLISETLIAPVIRNNLRTRRNANEVKQSNRKVKNNNSEETGAETSVGSDTEVDTSTNVIQTFARKLRGKKQTKQIRPEVQIALKDDDKHDKVIENINETTLISNDVIQASVKQITNNSKADTDSDSQKNIKGKVIQKTKIVTQTKITRTTRNNASLIESNVPQEKINSSTKKKNTKNSKKVQIKKPLAKTNLRSLAKRGQSSKQNHNKVSESSEYETMTESEESIQKQSLSPISCKTQKKSAQVEESTKNVKKQSSPSPSTRAQKKNAHVEELTKYIKKSSLSPSLTRIKKKGTQVEESTKSNVIEKVLENSSTNSPQLSTRSRKRAADTLESSQPVTKGRKRDVSSKVPTIEVPHEANLKEQQSPFSIKKTRNTCKTTAVTVSDNSLLSSEANKEKPKSNERTRAKKRELNQDDSSVDTAPIARKITRRAIGNDKESENKKTNASTSSTKTNKAQSTDTDDAEPNISSRVRFNKNIDTKSISPRPKKMIKTRNAKVVPFTSESPRGRVLRVRDTKK